MTHIPIPLKYFPDHFDFSEYSRDERLIIKPLMEADGYTNITFATGERDSFGPLSRLINATTPQGNHVTYVYG